MGEKGSYTLEATIIMSVIIIVVMLITVTMFNFFNRSFMELKINKAVMENIEVEKNISINFLMSTNKMELISRKYDEKFIDKLVIEQLIDKLEEIIK